jgi:hypothetical protein
MNKPDYDSIVTVLIIIVAVLTVAFIVKIA